MSGIHCLASLLAGHSVRWRLEYATTLSGHNAGNGGAQPQPLVSSLMSSLLRILGSLPGVGLDSMVQRLRRVRPQGQQQEGQLEVENSMAMR